MREFLSSHQAKAPWSIRTKGGILGRHLLKQRLIAQDLAKKFSDHKLQNETMKLHKYMVGQIVYITHIFKRVMRMNNRFLFKGKLLKWNLKIQDFQMIYMNYTKWPTLVLLRLHPESVSCKNMPAALQEDLIKRRMSNFATWNSRAWKMK